MLATERRHRLRRSPWSRPNSLPVFASLQLNGSRWPFTVIHAASCCDMAIRVIHLVNDVEGYGAFSAHETAC